MLEHSMLFHHSPRKKRYGFAVTVPELASDAQSSSVIITRYIDRE